MLGNLIQKRSSDSHELLKRLVLSLAPLLRACAYGFTALLIFWVSLGGLQYVQADTFFERTTEFPNYFLPEEWRNVDPEQVPESVIKDSRDLLEAALVSKMERMTVPVNTSEGVVQVRYLPYVRKHLDSDIHVHLSAGVLRSAIGGIYEEMFLELEYSDHKITAEEILKRIATDTHDIPGFEIRGVGSDLDVFLTGPKEKMPNAIQTILEITNSAGMKFGEIQIKGDAKKSLFTVGDAKDYEEQINRTTKQGGATIDFLALDSENKVLMEPPGHKYIVRDLILGFYRYIAPKEASNVEDAEKQTIRGIRPLLELPFITLLSDDRLIEEIDIMIQKVDKGGRLSPKALAQVNKIVRNARFSGANNRVFRGQKENIKTNLERKIFELNQALRVAGQAYIPEYVDRFRIEVRDEQKSELRGLPENLLIDINQFIKIHTNNGFLYHGTPQMDNAMAIMRGGLFLSGGANGAGVFVFGTGAYSTKEFKTALHYATSSGFVFNLKIKQNTKLNILDLNAATNHPFILRAQDEAARLGEDFHLYLSRRHGIDIIFKGPFFLILNSEAISREESLESLVKAIHSKTLRAKGRDWYDRLIARSEYLSIYPYANILGLKGLPKPMTEEAFAEDVLLSLLGTKPDWNTTISIIENSHIGEFLIKTIATWKIIPLPLWEKLLILAEAANKPRAFVSRENARLVYDMLKERQWLPFKTKAPERFYKTYYPKVIKSKSTAIILEAFNNLTSKGRWSQYTLETALSLLPKLGLIQSKQVAEYMNQQTNWSKTFWTELTTILPNLPDRNASALIAVIANRVWPDDFWKIIPKLLDGDISIASETGRALVAQYKLLSSEKARQQFRTYWLPYMLTHKLTHTRSYAWEILATIPEWPVEVENSIPKSLRMGEYPYERGLEVLKVRPIWSKNIRDQVLRFIKSESKVAPTSAGAAIDALLGRVDLPKRLQGKDAIYKYSIPIYLKSLEYNNLLWAYKKLKSMPIESWPANIWPLLAHAAEHGYIDTLPALLELVSIFPEWPADFTKALQNKLLERDLSMDWYGHGIRERISEALLKYALTRKNWQPFVINNFARFIFIMDGIHLQSLLNIVQEIPKPWPNDMWKKIVLEALGYTKDTTSTGRQNYKTVSMWNRSSKDYRDFLIAQSPLPKVALEEVWLIFKSEASVSSAGEDKYTLGRVEKLAGFLKENKDVSSEDLEKLALDLASKDKSRINLFFLVTLSDFWTPKVWQMIPQILEHQGEGNTDTLRSYLRTRELPLAFLQEIIKNFETFSPRVQEELLQVVRNNEKPWTDYFWDSLLEILQKIPEEKVPTYNTKEHLIFSIAIRGQEWPENFTKDVSLLKEHVKACSTRTQKAFYNRLQLERKRTNIGMLDRMRSAINNLYQRVIKTPPVANRDVRVKVTNLQQNTCEALFK